ncbi:MAG: hypothetical protein RI958_2843 [Actinomycetota bacterium]|jgi:hypothetical protein
MAEAFAESADRWLALLAGRNTWQDPEFGVDPASRSLALLQATSIATATATALVVWRLRAPPDGFVSLSTLALLAAASAALVGPIWTACGRMGLSRSAAANLARRLILGMALITGTFTLAPQWWAITGWPLGIALGCDAALTATAIGWYPRPFERWLAILLSPLHLGVIGGLLGTSLALSDTDILSGAVPIYVTLHVWLLTACAAAHVSQSILARQRHLVAATRAETVRDEHRRRAHWLHDDICAQLRLVTLRVQSENLSTTDVVSLLDDLDFALRLRQLDELIESGSVRLAELLQPFLRNAQNYGVHVERVPSYDVASTEVDHHTADLFRRAAAILMSNALNAGATTLALDVAVHPDHIELLVLDDAGGFDPSEHSVGRGLWSLRHDLGPDNLGIEKHEGGTRVRASIPVTPMKEHSWPT